jgi:hypothetical protein
MKYYLILLIFICSCTKNQEYTCVCHNNQIPESYQKYVIDNNLEEATANCNIMTNSNQTCKISK